MGLVCATENNRRKKITNNGNSEITINSLSEFDNTSQSFYQNNNNKNKYLKNNSNTSGNNGNIIEINSFFKEALANHNKYRKIYGSKELKLNFDLCELAQKYAEKCAERESLDHFPFLFNGNIISENIKEINSGKIDIAKICEEWNNELKNKMHQNTPQIHLKCNTIHATHMLWKDSKEVGFGLSTSTNGKSYFVAFYYPAFILSKLKDNI